MRLVPTALVLAVITAAVCAADKPRPLMRDFMGLNGHTVQFKPDLYAPVTRLVRDYHPIDWDFGDDTSYATKFPMARNGVDWAKVYGSWVKAGHRVDACLIFDDLKTDAWRDLPRDAYAYGKAFATAFGPSARVPLVEAAEIGNEPGKYDDATYRKLFEAMAGGIRAGDPKMRIATCAANLGKSGSYSKSVDCLVGLEALYDIVSIHNYAEIAPWPTWARSYAEDPKIPYLSEIRSVLTWRNQHAPGKEVWLTEFGWDASTKPAPATGTFSKWIGSTETEQALWTVRGYMVLAATGLDRAYLYFFNDEDTPQLHGSSGLTRNFVPKPAFHATAHLFATLGDYRLTKTLSDDPAGTFAYEYTRGDDPKQRILAVWKPAGGTVKTTLPLGPAKVLRAEQTPLTAEPAPPVKFQTAGGNVEVEASERPVFLWLAES